MGAETTQSADQAKTLANELLKNVPVAEDVQNITTLIREDQYGTPTLRLVISVPKRAKRSDAEIHRLAEFASSLQGTLLNSGVEFFPYFEFDEVA